MTLSLYHDYYQHQGAEAAKGILVLLHGWGMNSLVWDDLIPLLIEDYQICVIDLPGLGRSPMPQGEYDLDYLVAQVLAVAPEKAIWFGWSLGALIVQQIMQQEPQRVEQAFLIAATAKFIASENWPHAMPVAVFEKFYQLLLEDWQGTLIRFLTLQCKGSETIKEDARKLREAVFYYGLPAEKALRQGLVILQQSDLRERLKNIKQACHFILGEYDALIPLAVEKELSALNHHIQCHRIAGASHVPHLSHPQKVAEIFRQTKNKKTNAEGSAP